ncbi:peptide-methionine (R)-S-oxide reductase MsrB [Sphingorhabdus soli]|uniref:peptide-methionine (R)-S-oxide reductase n=1 Tax=Flavisphingopyxis soli TaxID=2601267 RepID=A0A5C6ULU5_9SPHN|nr:peptide-methionine (R)-S-oxide reductase MsrB [Sphingorhabdus soli]TXC73484.1 peptide-methionine (R)-S-oxide reductase MsrB [Sphingorhabdus soli]
MKLDRRTVITGAAASMLFAACAKPAAAKTYPYALSDAAWRKKLSPEAYRVLRQAATERPYSSPLNDEHRAGTFACAGCANPLYSSKTKFESGTGWPSFYAPLKGAIGTATDRKLGFSRTEVHCARCGGHLGHVFDDGPRPTGKRYCMNGAAMDFRSA